MGGQGADRRSRLYRLLIECRTAARRLGGGASNSSRAPVDWVRNHQSPRVQGDAGGKRLAAAVFPVAHDRMAVMGQLQADLVFPPRFQFDLQPGIAARSASRRYDSRASRCARHRAADDVHAAMPVVLP